MVIGSTMPNASTLAGRVEGTIIYLYGFEMAPEKRKTYYSQL